MQTLKRMKIKLKVQLNDYIKLSEEFTTTGGPLINRNYDGLRKIFSSILLIGFTASSKLRNKIKGAP